MMGPCPKHEKAEGKGGRKGKRLEPYYRNAQMRSSGDGWELPSRLTRRSHGQSCESEGREKNATAAQEGSEEIGKGEDQGSETQVGRSPFEADMQDKLPAWRKLPTHGAKSGTHPRRMLESHRFEDLGWFHLD
ncbi:hypothetical protein NDU88_002288 [Pleurodeles waltl]|uniref:Uncharacterized protein n=1 Tax=Pleurodeles waltl TaxID=8319 RepID=A0AAV7UAB5_PLEWA|nr:hypothetical protein NDU88_002288 [Pleurodeles waltl]